MIFDFVTEDFSNLRTHKVPWNFEFITQVKPNVDWFLYLEVPNFSDLAMDNGNNHRGTHFPPKYIFLNIDC